MSTLAQSVSLHPYFQVNPEAMPQVKALLRVFVAKSATESGSFQYGFTIHGDEVFCRESYKDAESALAHLANVGSEIDQMLQLATLTRVEVHGPAAELEKLKVPLSAFRPTWYELECAVTR